MRKIILSLAAITALMLGGLGMSAASAAADVPGLAITQVGYNAYGADTFYNRNQEFVDVKNVGATDVNVKNLVVTDAWGKANLDDNPRHCNTYKVTELPGITTGSDGSVQLPAGHTIRVYTGRGSPSVNGSVHAVYLDSRCGYHGHIWGNSGDTAWIVLGSDSESFAYDFDNGYVVRP